MRGLQTVCLYLAASRVLGLDDGGRYGEHARSWTQISPSHPGEIRHAAVAGAPRDFDFCAVAMVDGELHRLRVSAGSSLAWQVAQIAPDDTGRAMLEAFLQYRTSVAMVTRRYVQGAVHEMTRLPKVRVASQSCLQTGTVEGEQSSSSPSPPSSSSSSPSSSSSSSSLSPPPPPPPPPPSSPSSPPSSAAHTPRVHLSADGWLTLGLSEFNLDSERDWAFYFGHTPLGAVEILAEACVVLGAPGLRRVARLAARYLAVGGTLSLSMSVTRGEGMGRRAGEEEQMAIAWWEDAHLAMEDAGLVEVTTPSTADRGNATAGTAKHQTSRGQGPPLSAGISPNNNALLVVVKPLPAPTRTHTQSHPRNSDNTPTTTTSPGMVGEHEGKDDDDDDGTGTSHRSGNDLPAHGHTQTTVPHGTAQPGLLEYSHARYSHEAEGAAACGATAMLQGQAQARPVLGVKGALVINLERRKDRKTEMLEQAKRLGIPEQDLSFLKATDGDTLDMSQALVRELFDLSRWHYGQNLNPFMNHGYVRSTVAVALSHYRAWQAVALDGSASLNDAFLILEDDAVLAEGFVERWDGLFRSGPLGQDCSWDVFWLGLLDDRDLYGEYPIDYSGAMRLRPSPYRSFSAGAFGYALRKKGAIRLVALARARGITQAVDWFMFDQCGLPAPPPVTLAPSSSSSSWAHGCAAEGLEGEASSCRPDEGILPSCPLVCLRARPALALSPEGEGRDSDNNVDFPMERLLLLEEERHSTTASPSAHPTNPGYNDYHAPIGNVGMPRTSNPSAAVTFSIENPRNGSHHDLMLATVVASTGEEREGTGSSSPTEPEAAPEVLEFRAGLTVAGEASNVFLERHKHSRLCLRRTHKQTGVEKDEGCHALQHGVGIAGLQPGWHLLEVLLVTVAGATVVSASSIFHVSCHGTSHDRHQQQQQQQHQQHWEQRGPDDRPVASSTVLGRGVKASSNSCAGPCGTATATSSAAATAALASTTSTEPSQADLGHISHQPAAAPARVVSHKEDEGGLDSSGLVAGSAGATREVDEKQAAQQDGAASVEVVSEDQTSTADTLASETEEVEDTVALQVQVGGVTATFRHTCPQRVHHDHRHDHDRGDDGPARADSDSGPSANGRAAAGVAQSERERRTGFECLGDGRASPASRELYYAVKAFCWDHQAAPLAVCMDSLATEVVRMCSIRI